MNKPDPNESSREWIESMLIRLREGEATADEVTRLRDLLTRDPEARRAYLRATQMDTLLETASATRSVAASAATKESRVQRWWRTAAIISSAAAVIALSFIGIARFSKPLPGDGPVASSRPSVETPDRSADRDMHIAVLKSSYEAVIDGREVLAGELPMRPGTFRLERGSVQLQFKNGADVVIEGPAAFDLVDSSTMHLNQGSLWAHCPKQARGFLVRMPGGRELVDFGTEFGARVDAEGIANVSVIQGEVRIRDEKSRSLDLTAGKAASWELTAPPIAVDPKTVASFQNAVVLAEKVKLAPSLEQQTVVSYIDPVGGNWNTPQNWRSGALPGSHRLERAVINQSRVVRVLPGLPATSHPVDVHVSNGPSSRGGPDGTLEISGNLECQIMRIATADGAHGVVRHTGGTLNVTGSFLASAHEGFPAMADYSLSDGALNVGHVIALGRRGPAVFTLKGHNAVITADRMSLGANAVIRFVLDSEGAALIKLRDTVARNAASKLVVDGSAYRGGAAVLPLIICGNSSDAGLFTADAVEFVGFAGIRPQIATESGQVNLVLEVSR